MGNLKAQAEQTGKFDIGTELEEAYFITKGIPFPTYRMMPPNLINKIRLIFELHNIAEKAQERKLKAKK